MPMYKKHGDIKSIKNTLINLFLIVEGWSLKKMYVGKYPNCFAFKYPNTNVRFFYQFETNNMKQWLTSN